MYLKCKFANRKFLSALLLALAFIAVTSTAPWARALPAYKPDANAPRSDIPNIYKWDLTPLFKSDGAWESAHNKVRTDLRVFKKYDGKLNSADSIADCLGDYFKMQELLGYVTMYANLKNDQDVEVGKYERLHQKSVTLAKDFSAETSFVKQQILTLNDATFQKIMSSPRMKPYASYIDEFVRRKSHLLGKEAENVLSLAGDNLWAEIDINEIPSDVEMIFKAIMRDIKLPKIKDENDKEVQLTFSNYGKYRASKVRRVRRETVEGLFKVLDEYKNIYAAALIAEMKRDVFLAKARKYDRAIDAYLDRENVSPKVVDNLIRTINKNLKPLHRYVAIRKKLLSIPDLHIYDLYTPLVPAVDVSLPYEEAAKETVRALKPLGQEYIDVLSKAIQPGSGWVDIYPNKGKESGAFAASVWGVHPFIKLNYMDELDNAFTLAHEFGHGMHSHLNMHAQPFVTFGYSTLIAEVASTFNEGMLCDYLLEKYKDDDDVRLYLLGQRLESIRTTIYRQTLFAEFEKMIHDYIEAGKPVTTDLMNKTYRDLIQKYYGSGFTIGENDAIEWAYIPHLYWKFYVFTYATGLSSGIALSETVREDPKAKDRYLEMLKQPNTKPPLEILKEAGADLTKPYVIEAAADLMDRTITKMERIIAKKGRSPTRK